MDVAMRRSRCHHSWHRYCLASRWQSCPRCCYYWHLHCHLHHLDTHSNYSRPHRCDTHHRSNHHRYQIRDDNPNSRNNHNRSLNEDVWDGGRLVRKLKFMNSQSECGLCGCVCGVCGWCVWVVCVSSESECM